MPEGVALKVESIRVSLVSAGTPVRGAMLRHYAPACQRGLLSYFVAYPILCAEVISSNNTSTKTTLIQVDLDAMARDVFDAKFSRRMWTR